jgi:hypothetical protein
MAPKIPKVVEEWTWNPTVMQDDEQKELNRNDPLATAEMVYNVLWTLVPLHEHLVQGTTVWFSMLCLSKDMWDATNYARLWTEGNHEEIDSLLQEALGHVAEMHYMIESMWAWDKFTLIAIKNVATEVEYAIAKLQEALVATEFYIYDLGDRTNGNEES